MTYRIDVAKSFDKVRSAADAVAYHRQYASRLRLVDHEPALITHPAR